jgi:transposase
MRQALPVIREDAATLKQRLPREHGGRQRPRLQMLYLLASGQAQTRQAVAHLLGVHRNTVGHWLAIDAARGLDALLDLYVPAGKPLSLPPGVLAALAQALRHPTGFASYEALRQWVRQQHHLDVNYHSLYTIVRTKLKAKLKVPRPSHTKKTRTPSRHFKRPVRSGWNASFRLTTPGRCACSVRTKAASAC